MSSRGVLFLNGEPPKIDSLQNEYAVAIAADGAYLYAKNLCKIDKVVGDFDSLLSSEVIDAEVIKLNTDKDFTDGEVAVDLLIKLGIKEADVFGAAGLRDDHFLANIFLMKFAYEKGLKLRFISNYTEFFISDKKLVLNNVLNKTISLLPFESSVHIINTKGLKYNLTEYDLKNNNSLGVSNIAVNSTIEVNSTNGLLLVFIVK